MKRYLSAAGSIALFLWLAGGVCAGFYYNYEQKRACIQSEGWLKGWLWCSTEIQSTFTNNFLRGLLWPFKLAMSRSGEAQASGHEPVDSQRRQLTSDQRKLIQHRCVESSEAHKRRSPDVPGISPELCMALQEKAALDGEPSYLTMTPDDFAYHNLHRELTPQEATSMLTDSNALMKMCMQVSFKAMVVQPLVKNELQPNVSLTSQEMAAQILKMKPEIAGTNYLHFAVLSGHMQQAGLYGTSLDYFLNLYDSCTSLSGALKASMRDKDARSQPVTELNNKYRATLAEQFTATQGLRDKVYKDEPS